MEIKSSIEEATLPAPPKRGCNSRESRQAVRQRGFFIHNVLWQKE
jgi:hypothetical protein